MRHPRLFVLLIASLSAYAVEVTPLHLDGLLQPQIAVGADGAVQVVGVTPDNGGSDVVWRKRGADGVFSAAKVVNDQPRAATCIGTIRGARFALGRDGSVQVVWNGRDGKGFWYSRDFAPARNLLPAGDGVDGGGAIAADAQGQVVIAYHHQAGATSDEGRRIAAVRSDDDGVTLSAARAVTLPAAGACGCCSLAAGLDGQGRLELLVRNAAQGGRDMWFVGGDGQAKMIGAWRIAMCPMSTAAIVHAGAATYLAWEQAEQVWWCKVGRAPVAVGKGKYPALAVDGVGTVLVAWAVGTGWNRGGSVKWQAYDGNGVASGAVGNQAGLVAWGAPGVFVEGNGRFGVLW